MANYQNPRLHETLANEHSGAQNWGFRHVNCADCEATSDRLSSNSELEVERPLPTNLPQELDWIYPECVISYQGVGTPQNTAQCHPYLFTSTMYSLALESGAEVLSGTALHINVNERNNSMESVTYTKDGDGHGNVLPATHVILAAGAWCSQVYSHVSVGGAKCHSIIMNPPRPLSANMLFLNIKLGNCESEDKATPELYPRPDGTVYACEAADPSIPLPKGTADVSVDLDRCDAIHKAVAAISEPVGSSSRMASQACHQPIILHNGRRKKNVGPLLGPVDINGLFIAAGHDSWGISNAPATGKILSEMVLDGEAYAADVRSLLPELVKLRAEKM